MQPINHLILGIVLAAVLFATLPEISLIQLGIIVASSVLIDIDHYFYYIYKKKKINPITAYKWYTANIRKGCSMNRKQKEKIHFGTCFLHGIEILILLLMLGFFVSKVFYFILIGFTFHLLLDLSVEIIYYNVYNKISIIYTICKSRGLTFIDDM